MFELHLFVLFFPQAQLRKDPFFFFQGIRSDSIDV